MNEKLVKINSDDDDEEVPGSTRASPMAERATQTIESAETAMALDSSTSGAGKSKSRDNIDLERGLTLSVSELDKSQQAQQQQQQEQQFRLSPMRWTILIGFCVFGFCNGLTNEVNSILHVYVSVLDISVTNYVYYSQMFFFVPIIASFLAAAIVGKYGARTAIFIAITYAAVRNSARALLFSPGVKFWKELRFFYWIANVVFMQLSVAIYYCLPLRLAESWFAERERSLALSLFIVTPILGCATAALIYPHYIVDVSTAQPLAWINLTSALVIIVAISVCVHRSSPKEGAPSARNQKNLDKLNEQAANCETLATKLKRIFTHYNFLIHALALGTFETLMATIQSILQDLFANAGLSQVFCGQFLSISIILASVIQIGGSILLKPSTGAKSQPSAQSPSSSSSSHCSSSSSSDSDSLSSLDLYKQAKKVDDANDPYRTRVCKIMVILQCLTFVVFAYSLILHELYSYKWLLDAQWWLIIVTSIAYTLVRYSAAPYYNEQLTELICGRVSEPVCGAFQIISFSVLMNIYSVSFVFLRQEAPAVHTIDGASSLFSPATKVHQMAVYKYSVFFVTGVAILVTFIYLIWFNPNKQDRPLVRSSTTAKTATTLAIVSTSKTAAMKTTRKTTTTQK